FLAWIRTALALMAGGLALVAFELPLDTSATVTGACALVGLGVVASAAGWMGWLRNERALRHQRPLPGPPAALLVTAGLALGAVRAGARSSPGRVRGRRHGVAPLEMRVERVSQVLWRRRITDSVSCSARRPATERYWQEQEPSATLCGKRLAK